MTVPQAIAQLQDQFHLSGTVEEGVRQICALVAQDYAERVQLKPFARDYLDQLRRQGVPLALATASEPAYVMPALERLGLVPYFTLIVTRDTLPLTKRQPIITGSWHSVWVRSRSR